MKKLINWLSNDFAPKVTRFTDNSWIQTLTTALSAIIPIIMIGSVVSIYNVFRDLLPFLPDLSGVYNFSFGMISLALSAGIGYYGMEKLKHNSYKMGSAFIALCAFMMVIRPEVENFTATIKFGRFGGSGMIPAFVAGLLTVAVIHLYAKLSLFKKSNMPDFLLNWLNIIIPGFVVLFIMQLLVVNMNLDVFQLVTDLFSPIASFAQTLPGFILICLLPAFFYSLGINSWFFNPITSPVNMAGIEANIAAIAAGGLAVNIVTAEVTFSILWVGGMGCTLMLNIFLLRSKSHKLRSVGKISIIPSLFNINEPLVFAAPIAMNPLLMLPMWINAIVAPIIVWIFMRTGIVSIPQQLMRIAQIPMPISSYLVTNDLKVVLLWAALLVATGLIWFPFFKAFENICLKEEAAAEVK